MIGNIYIILAINKRKKDQKSQSSKFQIRELILI